jgi:DNA-binding transcriptional LysR family regulator
VTRVGAEIVRHAEQIMHLSETLTALLTAGHPLTGTIRIGSADSFALTHLSTLLSRIAEQHPAAHVELHIDYSANLDRKLRAGELDLAFLNSPGVDPQVRIEPLLDGELAWFASPRLRMPRRQLAPADLVDAPILSNPRPSHLYTTVMDWFGAAGLTPSHLNTCTSLAIMTKLTADGFGVALLPPVVCRPEIRSRALRRLRTSPPLPSHRVSVAYRIDPSGPDLGRIAALAHEVVAER